MLRIQQEKDLRRHKNTQDIDLSAELIGVIVIRMQLTKGFNLNPIITIFDIIATKNKQIILES